MERLECFFNRATEAVVCTIDGTNESFVGEIEESCNETVAAGSAQFWGYLIAALVCTLFAGAMSGLTVGLMSFDEKNLSILMTQSNDDRERYHAKRVHNLIKRHHMLLVTLLFWNAAAFETLPICLDRLVPSWAAILISVTLILIFGEIVPQALCTGPRKLLIGSAAYWPVRALMTITYPIALVFAKTLDHAVGHAHDDKSKMMYVTRASLGITDKPDGMALVEVHGIDQLPKPESPVRSRRSSTEQGSIDNHNFDVSPSASTHNEADDAKLVFDENDDLDGSAA